MDACLFFLIMSLRFFPAIPSSPVRPGSSHPGRWWSARFGIHCSHSSQIQLPVRFLQAQPAGTQYDWLRRRPLRDGSQNSIRSHTSRSVMACGCKDRSRYIPPIAGFHSYMVYLHGFVEKKFPPSVLYTIKLEGYKLMGCQVFFPAIKDGYGPEILTIHTTSPREYFFISILFRVIHIMFFRLGRCHEQLV